ncbi:hypothetical protein HOG16_01655 [Candidatus Woesearchaeota archaeon]|jgi:hypothetical protein|nr:hypothetical protein [Candidatus Woesearchaeota archaeon]MBT4322059.1 hypothetical protein [Candidatus Woesearchaeota archaeon]MBT4630636.1 hypothetical protein [Candidatus Woesearchaeota archaeon]
MVKPQKDVFWKALVYTIIVFVLGVFAGYLLEESRVNKINDNFQQLLIEWDDAEAQLNYYQLLDEDFCDLAIQQNLKFGDEIYQRGLKLEEYESANRFLDELDLEKKKYNLLKTKFFISSKTIKEKCDADYEFVFYFYLDTPEFETKEKQRVVSRVLMDLKYELGDEIILMPLAADMDIGVINILVEKYNVQEYPTVIIKENIKITGVHSVDELMEFF